MLPIPILHVVGGVTVHPKPPSVPHELCSGIDVPISDTIVKGGQLFQELNDRRHYPRSIFLKTKEGVVLELETLGAPFDRNVWSHSRTLSPDSNRATFRKRGSKQYNIGSAHYTAAANPSPVQILGNPPREKLRGLICVNKTIISLKVVFRRKSHPSGQQPMDFFLLERGLQGFVISIDN